MWGLVILKYFYPILDKKDPPEDKEFILDPSGPLSKVIPIVISHQGNQDRNNLLPKIANSSTET